MNRAKWGMGIAAALLLLGLGVAKGKWLFARMLPISYEGTVQRINPFQSAGTTLGPRRQFAIVFQDGFICEGNDTAFVTVKPGDRIEIVGYHDVKGWPILDPEWWECEESQLVKLVPGEAPH